MSASAMEAILGILVQVLDIRRRDWKGTYIWHMTSSADKKFRILHPFAFYGIEKT